MKIDLLLSDERYFQLFIGKRIIKREIFKSKGKIPLYSANVQKPFGFVDQSNIDDFKHDYVLWGIDGNFDFSIKRKKEKFATTDHCGAIRILNSHILPEYLVHQLEIRRHELGFDRTLRASLANIRMVTVSIPIAADGTIDEAGQLELVEKYTMMQKVREEVRSQIDKLKEAIIEMDEEGNFQRVKLSTLFDFPETNSRITKSFCQKNKGTVPVYGCSKSEDSVLGFVQDKLPKIKYYKDSLTWNRNGSVGYVYMRTGKFSTNEDHRVLKLKPKWQIQIDPSYVRYVLQNEIRKLGYSFTNKLGKSKMENIEIGVPINARDGFDIKKQETISVRYKTLYKMKEEIVQHLQGLAKVVVEFK
ncbi:MAG: restriction endonuclease subunit S [Candidatus Zixiibacteriota bacterium]